MADELVQQVTQQAGTGGAGGLVGALLTYLFTTGKFAKQADVETAVTLAKAQITAEIAEKYVHKDEMNKVEEALNYLRSRMDQIADKILNK